MFTEMTCVSPQARITLGCTGLWNDEQADGLARHRGFRPHAFRREALPPARPFRAQGGDQAHVGRHGSSARGGCLGHLLRLAGPLFPRQPGAAGGRAAPTWSGSRPISSRRRSAASGPASTCSSSTAPTAICSRASSRRSPTGAPTPTAARSRTACASRSRCSRRCAPSGPSEKPMSVRISATDWAEGGLTGSEAVAVAQAFAEAGVDLVDVSDRPDRP